MGDEQISGKIVGFIIHELSKMSPQIMVDSESVGAPLKPVAMMFKPLDDTQDEQISGKIAGLPVSSIIHELFKMSPQIMMDSESVGAPLRPVPPPEDGVVEKFIFCSYFPEIGYACY